MVMARPRKMTTEQMMEIVDSYYLTCCDGNEKLMKCSLIAQYAVELGYSVQGYDFRRNMEIREHIEQIKISAETSKDVYGVKYQHSAYKNLDVDGFLRNNKNEVRLTNSLRELDSYWERVYEYSVQTAKQNRVLLNEKSSQESLFKELQTELDRVNTDNSELSVAKNKLFFENRYLRKMLRTYLYPAVADEILRSDNEPIQTDTEVTDKAVCDFIEVGIPKSFTASVANDDQLQSESEQLIERLWNKCDE